MPIYVQYPDPLSIQIPTNPFTPPDFSRSFPFTFFILLTYIDYFAQKLLTCSVTTQTSISVFSQRCRPTSANLAVCRQLPPPSPANYLLIDLCILIIP